MLQFQTFFLVAQSLIFFEYFSRSKTTSITPRPSSGTTPFQFDPAPFDPFSTPEPPTTPSSAPGEWKWCFLKNIQVLKESIFYIELTLKKVKT